MLADEDFLSIYQWPPEAEYRLQVTSFGSSLCPAHNYFYYLCKMKDDWLHTVWISHVDGAPIDWNQGCVARAGRQEKQTNPQLKNIQTCHFSFSALLHSSSGIKGLGHVTAASCAPVRRCFSSSLLLPRCWAESRGRTKGIKQFDSLFLFNDRIYICPGLELRPLVTLSPTDWAASFKFYKHLKGSGVIGI